MGVVYEALHDAIERRVAIKVLHPEYCRNAEVASRFVNEARVVNRVGHPGLVQIFDHGQLPDGTAYLVMELLQGETLAHRLQRAGGGLPWQEVLRLGILLAECLVAAHAKGVVHRDLKPDNVMIVPDTHAVKGERTKLLDFGIAKQVGGAAGPVRTAMNVAMGTPAYMSPEQCLGAGQVDDRTDVYSLGMIFYEMLSGAVPFSGSGMGEIMCRQISEPPPPLAALAPAAPLPVCNLVHDMLCKDRQQRPAMCQVLAALQLLTAQLAHPSGRPTAVPLAAVTLAEPRVWQPAPLPASTRAQPARSTRQRAASVATAAVITLALTGGVYELWTQVASSLQRQATSGSNGSLAHRQPASSAPESPPGSQRALPSYWK